jgi:hypothetical protein
VTDTIEEDLLTEAPHTAIAEEVVDIIGEDQRLM